MNLSIGGKSTISTYAKKRIDMEHNMCRIKNHRIMSDTFRNRLMYNRISDIVSELVNYRIMGHHHYYGWPNQDSLDRMGVFLIMP